MLLESTLVTARRVEEMIQRISDSMKQESASRSEDLSGSLVFDKAQSSGVLLARLLAQFWQVMHN